MCAKSPHDRPKSAFDLLADFGPRIHEHDDRAKSLQQKRWRIGCSLIVLGPLAVLFSTAQFVWQVHGIGGAVLEVLDAALLLAALVVSVWHVGASQHEEWIRERLCTEILRRESFLLGAQVGPYLDPGVLSIRVDGRLKIIGSPTKDLVDLVPMVDEPGARSWRDELEDSRGKGLPSLPDLPSAIDHYLKDRVEDQQGWFARRSATHAGRTSWFEKLVLAILILAVLASLAHFRESVLHPEQSSVAPAGKPSDSPTGKPPDGPPAKSDEAASGKSGADGGLPLDAQLLFFGGIFLTMIGVITTGFQALLENERLSRSYAYHSSRLEGFASHLRELQSELTLGKSTPQEVQFRFKRIVLDVEGMFSEELMQWRLVMEPRAPRAEA